MQVSSSEDTFSFLRFYDPPTNTRALADVLGRVWSAGLAVHASLINECTEHKLRSNVSSISDYLDIDTVWEVATVQQRRSRHPWSTFNFAGKISPENLTGSFWWVRPTWNEDTNRAGVHWIETTTLNRVSSLPYLTTILTNAVDGTVSHDLLIYCGFSDCFVHCRPSLSGSRRPQLQIFPSVQLLLLSWTSL